MSEMKVRKRAKISSILKFVLIAILGFALLGVGIHTTASYSKTTEISVAIMSTDNGTYYNAANGGRVLVNGASVGLNGAQTLRVGQQTTLKAKANEGYTFVGFFTDITQLEKLSGSAEYSFVADEDVSKIYASFAKNYEISFEIADPFNDGQTLLFTETLYVGQEVAVSDIIANNESLGENAEEIAAYYENSTPTGEGDIGGFSFAKNKIIVGTQATNITIQPTEPTQVGWAGGTGTKDDPYIINTPALLNTLSSDVNAGTTHSGEYFSITAPITVSTFTPIGGANYAFEGILRGNDYTITISSLASATLNYAGLFGWNAGTIDGLNVAASATITGGSYVGTIAAYNTGTISYCESTATVSGSGSYIGGLVGVNGGTIKYGYMHGASVTGSNQTFGLAVGGAVGINLSAGKMQDVISTANTTGAQYQWVGAMIGQNHGVVQNSFSTGNATGAYYVGGIAGQNGGGTIFNTYSRGVIKSNNTYAGGVTGFNNGGKITFSYYFSGGTTDGNSKAQNGVGSGTLGGTTADTFGQTTAFNANSITGSITRPDIPSSLGTLVSSTTVNGYDTTNLMDALNYGQNQLLASSKTYHAWGAATDYFGGYPTIYYTEYGAGSGMSWAGYGGTGTGSSANDAYLIENERQLFALANNVNGGTNYANKYFKLTKNISLTQPFRSIGWYNTGTGANNYFAGTFDGQGYTISNLTITTASNGNNANYMGLFGYVYTGATIKNLNVAVTATGGSYVGGLAGYNMGTISNVMVSGTVSGSGSYIGGIVGVNSGTIKNAYNKATVNGTNSTFGLAVGNVVGINLSAGKMFNIIATGNTTASQYQWVGAMIGQNHGTLQNSFSTGNATGAYYVGGIAGQNGGGTLFNIYSRGTIKANNTYAGGVTGYNNGGTVKYCYYLKGKTTAGSTTHNGIGSASTTVTADTANVTTSFTSTASGVGKSRIDILSSAGTLSTSMAVEGQAATTNLLDVLNFAQANLAASSKEYVAWGANSAYFSNYPTIYYTGWDAGSGTKWTGYGGDGDGSTAAKAYLIENEKHLLSLVNEVIAGQNQSGKFFKVAADITLTRDLTSIGMYVTSTSKSNSFNGTFDGQGHTIKGLNISATSNNQPNYMGLFGWNAGTVKNLFVEGNVSGGSYVGGIAGYNTGTISNVFFKGTVKGTGSYIGGIAGVNGGTINACTHRGYVTGTNGTFGLALGGIAGINLSGKTIKNCYADGFTSAGAVQGSKYQWVGGIAGQNHGNIYNSYNNKSITAAYYAGGIAGQNGGGTIANTYNRATQSATSNAGAITGYNNAGTAAAGSNWYVSGTANTANGTSQTNASTLLSNLNSWANSNSYETWVIGKDGYPALRTSAGFGVTYNIGNDIPENLYFFHNPTASSIRVDFDASTGIVTMNGSASAGFVRIARTADIKFVEGEIYTIVFERLGGTASNSAGVGICHNWEFMNASGNSLGSWADNRCGKETTPVGGLAANTVYRYTMAANAAAASNGKFIVHQIGWSSSGTNTFNNYQFRVAIYRGDISTTSISPMGKEVFYGVPYGDMIDSSNVDIKPGYEFGDWQAYLDSSHGTFTKNSSSTWYYGIQHPKTYATPGRTYSWEIDVYFEGSQALKNAFDANVTCTNLSGNDAAATNKVVTPALIQPGVWTTVRLTVTIASDAVSPYIHHTFCPQAWNDGTSYTTTGFTMKWKNSKILTSNSTTDVVYTNATAGSFSKTSSSNWYAGLNLTNTYVTPGETYKWELEVYHEGSKAITTRFDSNTISSNYAGNDVSHIGAITTAPSSIPSKTWTKVSLTVTIRDDCVSPYMCHAFCPTNYTDGSGLGTSGLTFQYRNQKVICMSGEDKITIREDVHAHLISETGAITLYPTISPITYTLTLDANGGTGGSASVKATFDNTKTVSYTAPTRAGYTFAGYATDKTNGKLILGTNGAFTPNIEDWTNEDGTWAHPANATLYAIWTPNNYTVTLNPSGGTIQPSEDWTVAADGTTATKSVTMDTPYGEFPTVKKQGYKFEGWAQNIITTPTLYGTSYFTSEAVENGYAVTCTAQKSGNDFSLQFDVANLKPNTDYRFSFDYKNSNSNLISLLNSTYVYSTELWDSPNLITTGGNDFVFNTGENTSVCIGLYNSINSSYGNAVGQTITYTNISLIEADYLQAEDIMSIPNNHILTAYYSIATFDVVLKDGESTLATLQATCDETTSLTFEVPTKTGYTFGGFENDAGVKVVNVDGTFVAGVADWTNEDGTWAHYSPCTLTAIWTANQYNVTLKVDENVANDIIVKATYDSAEFEGEAGDPNRAGYTFKGWYSATTEAEGTLIIDTAGALQPSTAYTDENGNWTYTSDVILYGIFEVNSYTITLKNGEETVAELTAVYDSTTTFESQITNPEKVGHDFGGWYTAETGGDMIINTTGQLVSGKDGYTTQSGQWQYADNLTLYAQWTAQKFTVTFNANGGTAPNPESKSVTYGQAYGDLATIERTGYTFDGWFTEIDGGTEITAQSIVEITADQNLYAHWTINQYTLSVIYNSSLVTDATNITVSAPDSTIATASIESGATATVVHDYTTTNVVVTITIDNASNIYFLSLNSACTVESNTTTLEYTWNAIDNATININVAQQYAITYNDNHKTDNKTLPETTLKVHGTDVDIAVNDFERTGYTANGWNTSADATGTAYANGAAYADNANLALYLAWTPNTNTAYKVEHYVMDTNGKYSDTPTAITDTEETKGTTDSSLTLASLKDSSLEVAGGIAYDHAKVGDATATEATILADGSLVVKLYYARTQHTLTTVYDNGDANGTGTYYYGKSITLPTKTNAGYTFSGNYTLSPTTTGASIDGNTFTMGTADVTVTYVWIANTITITLDNQNANEAGSAEVFYKYNTNTYYSNNQATAEIEKISLPSRTGYTFGGYFTQTNGNDTQYITADGTFTNDLYKAFNADATLYAKWTANTYDVNFNANDGETPSPASITVTYDTAYGTLATTTRTGYTFAGWFTAASGGEQITAETIVKITDAQTLYAHWTANEYAVTFNANGGTAPNPASKNVTYDSAYGALATTTLTGHTFAGWWTAANGGEQITAESTVKITAAQTLYAHWTINTYTLTVKYFDVKATDATNITVSAPDSTIETESIASGATATVQATYNVLTDVVIATANTSFDYFISVDTPCTLSSAVNTYTHKWTPTEDATINVYVAQRYAITYNDNQKTDSKPLPETQYKMYGENITLAGNNFERTGYQPNGWNTSEEISATPAFASSAEYSLNENKTLYLNWTANVATVTIQKDGAAYTSSGMQVALWQNDEQKFITSDTANATATFSVVPEGTYNIYATAHNATGATLVDTGVTITATGSATINYYTLTLNPSIGISEVNANGKAGGAVYLSGQTASIVATMVSGYNFGSWTGIGDLPAENDRTSASTTVTITQPTTLTANRALVTYTLTYDFAGGTLAGGTTVEFNVETNLVAKAAPALAGYTFTNWKVTTANGNWTSNKTYAAEEEIGQGMYGDATLTAQYEANTYTVSFDSTGGSAVADKTVTFDSAYGSLTSPTRTGFVFDKWTLDGTEITSATIVKTASNHTLVAQWIANELVFNDQTLTSGIFNTEYNGTFTAATNGTGDYEYTITGATLDGETITEYNGLEIDSANHAIVGTPAAAGTYVFTVQAADDISGKTKSANMTIVIDRMNITGTAKISGTMKYGETLTASVENGIANATYSYMWQFKASGASEFADLTITTQTLEITSANLNADAVVGGTIRVVVLGTGNFADDLTSAETASITAKEVSWQTLPSVDTKVYDGNTVASIAAHGTIKASDIIAGDIDNVTLDNSNATATFASADAGTHDITFTGYALSGTRAGNYTLAMPEGVKGTITTVALTITADDKSMVYGTSAPTYTVTATGFVNGETLAVIGGTPVFTIKSDEQVISDVKNANVGTYTITPSGFTSTNYAITFVDGTLTITKAPSTFTITQTTINLIYNKGTTTNYIYNGDGDVSASNYDSQIVSVDINNSGKIITLTSQKAGTTTITFTAAEGTNFKAATATLTVVVSKATVTITKLDPVEKTYDGTTTAEPVQDTHYTVSSNGAPATVTLTRATFDSPNVGTRTVTAIFTLTDTNFEFAEDDDNDGTIEIPLDGEITMAKLATPTNLVLTGNGLATWDKVTAFEDISITYDVTLYKNGSVYGNTQSTPENSYNFADIMHAEAAEYSFKVQAKSSNADNCEHSDISALSSSVYTAKITVAHTTGITSANIKGGLSYIMISGESDVTITATLADGYTFSGWTLQGTGITFTNINELQTIIALNVNSTNEITITANASANTNTPYKVEHYVMEINGKYPNSTSIITDKTGSTGQTLTLENLATYAEPGFTYSHATVNDQTATTAQILGDGSLVIKLYYQRLQYTVDLQVGSKGIDTNNLVGENAYYHGASVTINITQFKDDYIFAKWVVDGSDVANNPYTFTMPTHDVVAVAYAQMDVPKNILVQVDKQEKEATITQYQGTATEVVIPDKIELDTNDPNETTGYAKPGVVYKVIAIASNAFNGNKNLQSVSIPATVITIGTYAFANCNSLTKIEILSTNVEIGDYAFGINTDDANISKQIYINDATVAKNIVKSSLYANPNLGMYDYGNLLVGANEVYIASSIVELSDFLTSSFEKIDKTTYRDVEYNVYRRRTNATATILRLREEDIDEEDITLEDFDDFI